MEIVGANIGGLITNDPLKIREAIKNNTVTEFLDRGRMQLMAAFGLGQQWTRMAESPTLFEIER